MLVQDMPLNKNDVIIDEKASYTSDTIYGEVYDLHLVQLNTKIKEKLCK